MVVVVNDKLIARSIPSIPIFEMPYAAVNCIQHYCKESN